MQRLSNWLGEHLNGRKRRDKSSQRPPIASSPLLITHLDDNSSHRRRRTVCTNPWLLPSDSSFSNSFCSSIIHPDGSLRISGSSCSSGYGTQDNSPECSIHQPSWQPSTQIESHDRWSDKAVECSSADFATTAIDSAHIYYELESPKIDSCYSGSIDLNYSLPVSSSPSSSDDSRCDSPIYAVPYSVAGESSCGSIEYADDSDGYVEMARRFDHSNEHSDYAEIRRLPQIPQRKCLDDLDDQIAQLKMKTEMVSRLVETAKERRELRDCARLLCLEHIQKLRSMRWYVENSFEMQI